ncbi:oxysterol-binding protein, PH domain-like protein [Artemisia annua]|uniref:Oxysterol-binding protein, PH domain-like protein n=1 Tax=Artemisia annua TaxID=35608 RepID=A0A2U1NR48_ARTAN|nr:oxysterol-binding protein, PH domain-like protein [Artemisia annua]
MAPSVVNNHDILSNGVAEPPMIENRISGILHKWVNCGKRWKPRWFVLQDGVLSYYKIHGPDKIVVSKETNEGCRIIGGRFPHHRKPLGELHLKVSSIYESGSDDRRFSIFTGSKRLHLKATSREDQMEWMEALKAVKRMFPRMSNSELMNPTSSVTLSTDKLRERLLEEGVNEEIIQDAEKIVKTEFSEVLDELELVQKKLRLLIDTLSKL